MKIAVVGSGIAGLAACWYLGRDHQISLYEKQSQLGMAAKGLEWGGVRVDMPLRVIYRGYYPTLAALYADADIEIASADYSASFSDLDGRSYFRYRNWRPLPRMSLPYPAGRVWARRSRRILIDLARLYREAGQQSRRLARHPMSLQEWLDDRGYSEEFQQDFLLPTFAAINTCDLDSVRAYPAQLIVDYLRRGVLLEGVSRTVKGADDVVTKLSQHCADIRLSCGVSSLLRHEDGVELIDERGERARFDHVVLAAQGNQARRLLGDQARDDEQDILKSFQYVPSEVIVHQDSALMPARRRDWSPVNFFSSPEARRPMASIWLNRVLPIPADQEDVFQTWNPLREVDPAKVRARARFERPVVNAASQRALEKLKALHQEDGRRVWFCGSYAQSGVPLLESAARSARDVARHIGA